MWQFSLFISVFAAVTVCFFLWTHKLPDNKVPSFWVDSVSTVAQEHVTGKEASLGNVGTKRVWFSGHRVKHIPKLMMDLFLKKNHGVIVADVVKSLVPKRIGSMMPCPSTREHRQTLEFRQPDKMLNEELQAAQLRLPIVFRSCSSNHLLIPGIECLVQVYWHAMGDIQQKHLYSQSSESWIHFNITQMMAKFHHLRKGRTVQLVIGISVPLNASVCPDIASEAEDHQPILVLSFASPQDMESREQGGRVRRNAEAEYYEEETNEVWTGKTGMVSQTRRKQRNMCRRRPLYVDFSEINYDTWIVAPNGYEAYQCVGKCIYPLSEHLSPTKHAIVQTLVHNMAPGKASRACCVPTRLDPISVLYLDNQGVLTYRFSYKDMVVAECGCK